METGRKKKKIVKRVLICVLVLALLTGVGYGAYRFYISKSVAKVVPVSNIYIEYEGDEMESGGVLTNDSTQSFYLSDEDDIEQIYVTQGQQVTAGTPLLKYDTKETVESLSEKERTVQVVANDLAIAQAQLEKLRSITPTDETEEEKNGTKPEGKEKDKQAYRYLEDTAKPYEGKGTQEEPYRYLCTKDCYATSAFLKQMQKKEWICVFEVRDTNKLSGEVVSSTTWNGKHLFPFDDNALYTISSGTCYVPMTEAETVSGKYTRKELREEISGKQDEIMELQNTLSREQLEIKQLKESLTDATVLAKQNGVVQKCIDPAEFQDDGTPFLIVSASEKLYVQQLVDEYHIKQLKVGQTVKGRDWMTGAEFEAVIDSISDTPTGEQESMNYGGNASVSYYSITAYVEDTEGLENGDSVNLSTTVTEESQGIFIEKAYCRQEDGETVVYLKNKKGRLKRQVVTTGKTVWGSYIEILDGLTLEDYIAFPYGKTAKEGVRCEETDYLE